MCRTYAYVSAVTATGSINMMCCGPLLYACINFEKYTLNVLIGLKNLAKFCVLICVYKTYCVIVGQSI